MTTKPPTDNELREALALARRATPGPWTARTDEDYYQGGRYLGHGPLKYVPDKIRGGNKEVPCLQNEVEYFEQDVCRVEGGSDDEAFIAAARTGWPAAAEALLATRALARQLEEFAGIAHAYYHLECHDPSCEWLSRLRPQARTMLGEETEKAREADA